MSLYFTNFYRLFLQDMDKEEETKELITDFKLSRWLIIDTDSDLGLWMWTMLPAFGGTRCLHFQGRSV
jgi:hypothetical protein